MVDLLPHVRDLLAPLGAQIELSYNDISAEMPLIVLSEVGNMEQAAPDGVELLSNVTVQTDIYHTTEHAARLLAISAARIMTAAGFRRMSGPSGKEDDLYRETLTFSTTVDESASMLYRGASL